MNTYDKAIRAIEKSGLGFNFNIQVNDAGHCKYIVNLDARIPSLGEHTNEQEMRLPIDSRMSIAEMTNDILKKWEK